MKKRIPIILFLFIAVSLSFMASCTQLIEIFNPKPPHTTCMDINKDTFCDTCGKPVTPPQQPECSVHVDLNNDGVCDNCSAAVLKNMTGITFTGAPFTYDGTDKMIEVVGAPAEASVTYDIPNVQKNVGEYKITATVTCEGYNPYTVSATMYINARTVIISWGENLGPFPSNGNAPEIEYTLDGVVDGDEVEVTFNFADCDFTVPGTYEVTAVSANPNYKIRPKEATTEIIMGVNAHTVTFDTGIEDKTVKPAEVVDGEKIKEPQAPNNLGYEFLGWYNGDVKWNFSDPVTESMTLTAKWQASEYRVNYYLDGGINSPDNPDSFFYDEGLLLKAPKKEGYLFLGWYSDSAMTLPAKSINPFTVRSSVSFYAKWSSSELTYIESDGVFAEGPLSFVNTSTSYLFVADVSSFDETSAIYVGKGLNDLGGSYVKITADKIIIYTNTEDGQTVEERKHARTIDGYVCISVAVKYGKASVRFISADGESVMNEVNFAASNGKIFFKSENAVLENSEFAYSSDSYNDKVWVVGNDVDSSVKTNWTYHVLEKGYADIITVSSPVADVADILDSLREALESHSPKYIVWSFDKVSGADYDALTSEFISLCKAKSIVPILTVHPGDANADSVKSCGERYIDFTDIAADVSLFGDNGFTELGAELAMAEAIASVPEFFAPNVALKSATAEVLNSENSSLSLGNNRVKDEKYMVFSAKIDGELPEDAKIFLNHGYMTSYGRWAEINSKSVKICSYTSWSNPPLSERETVHGLTIKNYLTVILVVDGVKSVKKMTIATDGAVFTLGASAWSACEGELSVVAEGVTLSDVSLDWTTPAYARDIWIIGASYLSLGDPARWPHYYYQEGYASAFLCGRGGMGAQHGIVDFKDALQYGTPKYLVWDSVSGNNPDKASDVDPTFLEHTLQMLRICEEKGIKVYIQTMPNCPNQTNWYKNEAILGRLGEFANYDYEVIDLARSVGARDELNPSWFENMIHSDKVHPLAIGARASYMQIICDMPELILGKAAEVYKASSEQLNPLSRLKLSAEGTVKREKVITFRADFDGSLTGSITVGNGKNTEGGTWLVISSTEIKVYTNVGGEAKLIATEANPFIMQDLLNLRIHVTDHKASVSLMSKGEKNYDPQNKTLYSFTVDWNVVGDVFAESDSAVLTDAILRFCSAD